LKNIHWLLQKFLCSSFQIIQSTYEDISDRFMLPQYFFGIVVDVIADDLGAVYPAFSLVESLKGPIIGALVLLRQLSYAIKNQLGHPKPPTRGFGTQNTPY